MSERREVIYGYFKIDHLVGVGAHLIVEAEFVFTGILCREDRVNLSFLAVFHDDVGIRPRD